MKLFVHIGTEKTGSSYLQKLCGKNREFLQKNSYFFPSAGKHEKRLLDGAISPGNAKELADLIHNQEWHRVSKWLSHCVQAGKDSGCGCVLLSHELLVSALSHDDSVRAFTEAASRARVNSLDVLLMIRDPVSQAVSLYKHRAKNGAAGDIGSWIESGYDLPREIQGFLNQVEGSAIRLHVRKYVKDTESIIKVFFEDWLGVEPPPIHIDAFVNSSLTISELQVIRQVALARPADVPLFYAKFLGIPAAQKASDTNVETAVRAVVENHLCRFDKIWLKLDSWLNADGGLSIPVPCENSQAVDKSFKFSVAQVRAWAEGHSESRSIKHKAKLWLNRHARPLLTELKKKYLDLISGRTT